MLESGATQPCACSALHGAVPVEGGIPLISEDKIIGGDPVFQVTAAQTTAYVLKPVLIRLK